MTDQYVVPMLESERGWGQKIDGYAGPFPSRQDAADFMIAYNLRHNNKEVVPDWYLAAQSPVPYKGQTCEYRTVVFDDDDKDEVPL